MKCGDFSGGIRVSIDSHLAVICRRSHFYDVMVARAN